MEGEKSLLVSNLHSISEISRTLNVPYEPKIDSFSEEELKLLKSNMQPFPSPPPKQSIVFATAKEQPQQPWQPAEISSKAGNDSVNAAINNKQPEVDQKSKETPKTNVPDFDESFLPSVPSEGDSDESSEGGSRSNNNKSKQPHDEEGNVKSEEDSIGEDEEAKDIAKFDELQRRFAALKKKK